MQKQDDPNTPPVSDANQQLSPQQAEAKAAHHAGEPQAAQAGTQPVGLHDAAQQDTAQRQAEQRRATQTSDDAQRGGMGESHKSGHLSQASTAGAWAQGAGASTTAKDNPNRKMNERVQKQAQEDQKRESRLSELDEQIRKATLERDQLRQQRSATQYPRWAYHKDHNPILVQTPDEEEALGEGWTADAGEVTKQRQQAEKDADKVSPSGQVGQDAPKSATDATAKGQPNISAKAAHDATPQHPADQFRAQQDQDKESK